MIDRVYKFIQTVSNNELNGNISPQEFKLLVNNSVAELNEENLHALKRANNNDQRYGKDFSLENISEKLREKLGYYYTTGVIPKVDGKYAIPKDLQYLDAIELNGVQAEEMKNRRHFKAVSGYADTIPDLATPIFLRIGEKIEIAPTEVTGPIDIYYIRKPKPANWTYVLLNNTEIFNPDASDFQDIDIHPSEEYQLTIRILQKLGVNLKESELTQYGLTKETTDFRNENSN